MVITYGWGSYNLGSIPCVPTESERGEGSPLSGRSLSFAALSSHGDKKSGMNPRLFVTFNKTSPYRALASGRPNYKKSPTNERRAKDYIVSPLSLP